jgi:hypothetical protein
MTIRLRRFIPPPFYIHTTHNGLHIPNGEHQGKLKNISNSKQRFKAYHLVNWKSIRYKDGGIDFVDGLGDQGDKNIKQIFTSENQNVSN